jgi:hypothetical protein
MGLFSGIKKAVGSVTGKFIGDNFEIGGTLGGDSPSYNIQDRVKDAQKAGIHPLYAMGAGVIKGGQGAGGGGASLSGSFGSGQSSERKELGTALIQAQIDQANAITEETQARAAQIRADMNIKQDTAAIMAHERANAPYRPGAVTVDKHLPSSYVENPAGELTMFKGANGLWYEVDPSIAPVERLEGPFGEAAEAQGIARFGQGIYDWQGIDGNWPSLRDMVEGYFNWKGFQ